MRFAKAVVKGRVVILVLAFLLLIPCLIGYTSTHVNYDILTYLPEDLETVQGQDILLDDFGKGAFSLLVMEGMNDRTIVDLSDGIKEIDHVASVIGYQSLTDNRVPIELLPKKVYEQFNTGDSTLLAVFFDTSTSADETLEAIAAIRTLAGEKCFVTGMSAMVADMRTLFEHEEMIYVGIAVVLALLAMMIFLDSWIIPVVFLASIGIAILMNLGSNIIFGEISYITKALAAVLQLAVTMDYSIFLWHSYNEHCEHGGEHKAAMEIAIHETLVSVLGSSITTVAGFVAMCFMSFTLGFDLGIVMAKGVIFGVLGSVTILPSLILVLDRPLQKSRHRSLLVDMRKPSEKIIRAFPLFLLLFVIALYPAYSGYTQANNEVYYNIGRSLPEDIDYLVATDKLTNDFSIGATHMMLVDAKLDSHDVRSMLDEIEQVDGVKFALGLESLLAPGMPQEMLPSSIREVLKSDRWELILINSEYEIATDEVNAQIDLLNGIMKRYDENGLLIGEGPCTKDLISTTDTDFRVVNTVSIFAIFIIIMLVERSLTLPFILISVIEFAIFVNLAMAHYFGQSLPFIAPICISTIQLGATVDYAILMTTRYKAERVSGKSRTESVTIALSTSIPSIIVSGMGMFAATYGVAYYSDVDMISSICMLLARGALISMICVILLLPAMLMLFDAPIRYTTLGMRVRADAKHD